MSQLFSKGHEIGEGGLGVHVLFSLFSDIGISAGVVVKEVEDCYKEIGQIHVRKGLVSINCAATPVEKSETL